MKLISNINKLNLNPRKLFLIDGIGALTSSIFLGFILPLFQELIGMPTNILLYLSLFATALFFYSTYCFHSIKTNFSKHFIRISIANYSYCLISIFLLIIHFSQLTALGISYFIVEKLIVLTLATLELKTALK